MTLKKYTWIIVPALLCILVPGYAGAGEKDAVAPGLALPLFLKIITYDQQFSKDSINGISIYLVYDKSITKSYEQMKGSHDYHHSHKSLSVGQLPVNFYYISAAALEDSLKNEAADKYRMVVFTNIKQKDLKEAVTACKNNKAASFALDPSMLDDGVSVSIIIFDGKARILVDVESANSEGTQYSAHLLKVSKVHKDEE